jgi:hypothetical protein
MNRVAGLPRPRGVNYAAPYTRRPTSSICLDRGGTACLFRRSLLPPRTIRCARINRRFSPRPASLPVGSIHRLAAVHRKQTTFTSHTSATQTLHSICAPFFFELS